MVVTLGTQEADAHHSPDCLRNLGYPQAVERALVLNTISPSSSQIEYAMMLKLSLTYADDVTQYHICKFSCPSISTGMVLGPLGY